MTAKISVTQQKIVGRNKYVLPVVRITHTKDAQIGKLGNQNVLTVGGYMFHLTKGAWNTY